MMFRSSPFFAADFRLRYAADISLFRHTLMRAARSRFEAVRHAADAAFAAFMLPLYALR